MIEIPKEFQPQQTHAYPSYCTHEMLEQFCHRSLLTDGIERVYLPIYWTNYYVQKDYGNGDITPLYRFLDSLDKSKKYYTVVQYDDGILEKPSDLDLMVFSSGHPSGVPLPLVPSHYLEKPNTAKAYDLSFIGNLENHPIRRELVHATGCWHWDNQSPSDYYRILAQSEFMLCPRGYGVTSFRLYEALHCGAVPIYVSDVHWLPYTEFIDWDRIAIIVKPEEVHTIRDRIKSHRQDWGYYERIKYWFNTCGAHDYVRYHLLVEQNGGKEPNGLYGFLDEQRALLFPKETHKPWHHEA